MYISRISSKGQITLPRNVRQALQVRPGERVLFSIGEHGVVLQRVDSSTSQALAGSLRRYARGRQDSGQTRAAIKKEVARAAAHES